MATVHFRLRNGKVVSQTSPHASKELLEERVKGAMTGSSPIITIISMSGASVTLEKSAIKGISYED